VDAEEIAMWELLRAKRETLWRRLEKAGGRGVPLAEHIDRLDAAMAALRGELFCPDCERQLTGNA